MFLDLLIRRNPDFVLAAMALHRQGGLPANCYVLDLDAVTANAKLIAGAAAARDLTAFAMTKQVGRHSGFCKAVQGGGIDRAVAVDMACAVACRRAGLPVGHLGHLVQIPRAEVDHAAGRIRPDYWTVFSLDKAKEAAAASRQAGRSQQILARIQSEGDIFYRGHEGGFEAADIVAVADRIDALPGAGFAGITTFPALLFDGESRSVKATPNLSTLEQAAARLRRAGRANIQINAPGTTASTVLDILAAAGATQCEPGNGLHGTTPLHAVRDLPEIPAVLYLTEVSHLHAGYAYCFGGGLYIDPVFPDYDVKALVCAEPTVDCRALAPVELPPPAAIDYYGMIDCGGAVRPETGDSVVFGFRGQAFVKRALIAGIAGVSTGNPLVVGIENCFGQAETWPDLR